MIKGRSEYKADLPDITTELPAYTPDFNLLRDKSVKTQIPGGIMGGYLTIEVELYKTVSDKQTFTIKGTNPGQAAIDQLLVDPIARKIACAESHYQHFDAAREGGVGFPNVGRTKDNVRRGGAGIMQLYDPEPNVDAVWNWKTNITVGAALINTYHKQSMTSHIRERGRLNDDRAVLGLPSCPANVPTPLSETQVMRETIRRYNCGVEYRWEPRDAPDCAGSWVEYHPQKCLNNYDRNYINKVLDCKL